MSSRSTRRDASKTSQQHSTKPDDGSSAAKPDPLPVTPAPRKGTRLLTSTMSKASISLLSAAGPLLFLQLSWKDILQDPVSALTVPLMLRMFIVQTAFIILVLPLPSTPVKSAKKKSALKADSLSDSIKAQSVVRGLIITIDNRIYLNVSCS
jgi:hypothetical protein